jgi:hypothetical protein
MGAPFRRRCTRCGTEQLHIVHDGQTPKCIVCAPTNGPEALQDQVQRVLAKCKTNAQRIEYLTRAHVSSEGTLILRKTPRGRGAKNIQRMLSRGRQRPEQAKADGVDLSVLPPDSRIRRNVEAVWKRWVNSGLQEPPRGQAGREAARKAATTSSRGAKRRAQALELHRTHLELTAIQIADRLEPPLKGPHRERSVHRYLTGR